MNGGVLPLPVVIVAVVGAAVLAWGAAARMAPGRARRAVVAVGVLVVVAGGAYGVTTMTADPAPSEDAVANREAVRTGLCEVAALLPDDASAATDLFWGEVHQPIHGVAAELQELDAPLAGRLLVAKNAVEEDLAADASVAVLDEHVDALLGVTLQGLSRLSGNATTCPAGGG